MTTLVVGPLGARPWLTVDELAASIEALGQRVVVNGAPDDVLPMPPAWRPGAIRFVAAWAAWRRSAKRSLKRAGIERILVWDPVLTLVCRAARPRGVEIIWAPSPPGERRRDRIAFAAARRSADRMASVPPVLSRSEGLVDGWVAFGSSSPVSDTTLDALRQRAPASALVFDARAHDTISAGDLARLVEATHARHVWWCGEDEWVVRLGGVPEVAVDLASTFAADHRHLRALGAGAELLHGDTRVTRDDIADVLDDEHQWAAAAFGGNLR